MFADSNLDPGGPVALAQRSLLYEAVGLMLIVVAPVFILTALIVWRYRASNTGAKYTPDWDSSRPLKIGILPIAIVALLMGGRAAEHIVFGEISTGAADDLVKVGDHRHQGVSV